MECDAQQLPTFSGPHCVVGFSFNNAEDSNELNLNKGDVMEFVERVSGDWLRLAGKEGIFPVHFVNIIKDLPLAPTFVEILEELTQSNVRELMSYACGWGWDENECVVCQHVYNILYVFKMLMILD